MEEKEYQILEKVKAYVSKPDVTATPPEYLVSGSQNMLIDEEGKVVPRNGYTLYGDADATLYPIKSAYTWLHSQGVEHFLREYNGNLQIRLTKDETGATVSPYFANLLTGLSTTYPIRFIPAWNATELIDILLFVNHSAILYEWSGGYGTYASDTVGTVVINEVIGDSHFLTSGTRSIRILDTGGTWRETVYTGESASTFTTSTDLTAFDFAVGAPVVQVVRTNANTPASGFTNDYIDILENQIFVGSASSRRVYISKTTSYTDFSKSTPRVPTEGETITLDDVTTGFKVGKSGDEKEAMHIFSGKNWAYRVEFVITAGSTGDREIVKVKPIINAPNQGAKSQELIGKTKNFIVFLNNNNELVELGSVTNQNSLENVPISDPIKPDFIAADFSNGHIFFDTNSLSISAPSDGVTYIFDIQNRRWFPPQILPVRLFSSYGGDLYGHSASVPETYKLFTGTNDNDIAIILKAYYSYRQIGGREVLTNFNRYFTEMYITSNATVSHKLLFEYGGSKGIQTFDYKGSDTNHLFIANPLASLGQNSLGTNPLGGLLEEPPELIKYRRFKPIVPIDIFEFQCGYECETLDGRFEILAHGPSSMVSQNKPVKQTQ